MRKIHKTLKDGTKMTWPLCQASQKSWKAVMDYRAVQANATETEIAKVIQAYKELRTINREYVYVTYTQLRISKLAYPRIFAAIKTLKVRNPYCIAMTINRMDENTAVRIHLDKI